MRFEEKFIQNIKAGAKIIQLISYETQRIQGIVNEAANETNRKWYCWNRIEGLREWQENGFREVDLEDSEMPEVPLDFMQESNDPLILILEDFHPDLAESQVRMIRRLRNIALSNAEKTLILAQPMVFLPKELEKEVTVMELPLPSQEDLEFIFENICQQFGLLEKEFSKSDTVLQAALGLTIMEAKLAFGKAIVARRRLTELEVPIITGEKENIIKKSGFLEYYHPQESLEDVGGLEILKDWLKRRGKAFGPGAKDYGLDTPNGVLFLGIPGTGKSLAAKAIANAWQFPLLRLDMGRIFGGIVGESERNIREALQVAEAISPSILWIDEIEKGLSGAASSGATDGGTTSRVLGTFLTWMQEKEKPVFVVATANDVSALPPELLRKGRMDEIFFVDLPGEKAREEILSIHIKKKKRNPKDFDLKSLAKASLGFSGAELEEAIKEALFQGFDRGEEISTDHIHKTIKQTYPLSRTMGEMIKALREWACKRAVLASKEPGEDIPHEDKKTPRLKQETQNPFISSRK